MIKETLRFDERVVVITGAGGGFGRAHAFLFASRGATLVLNDNAIISNSNGQKKYLVDDVVHEITKAGFHAIANYEPIGNGDKIIEAAMNAFGRVDILINNAGVTCNKPFKEMSDKDWEYVHNVNLHGAYKVTKAVWPIMQKQKYGRIINIVSAAGLYGSYGQSNYSSAKMALHGFTLSLAREGYRYNIYCNCVSPYVALNYDASIKDKSVQVVKPEFLSPLLVFLTHEKTRENGSHFEAGAGYIGKLRWERSQGSVFKAGETFTPGAVAAKWNEINDFNQSDYPTSALDNDWFRLLEKSVAMPSNNDSIGDLSFKGRVVIVTGAGGGLGRAYAKHFAKLGASVVVNDLGVLLRGRGANTQVADGVVEEIKKMGGIAVPSYDSVEEGEKIVETAIKNFGRVDIIINNAGILRDRSFARMTDTDWMMTYRVHLKGTYKVTRAAWPYMMKQKYGRIINITSAAGLFGNFGQSNYAAAKSGVIGLTNALALEGKEHNITINSVAPNAGTRMTATIMPQEMVELLKPEYTAPLISFLTHESCNVTGGIYEVGSCWVARLRWQRSGGASFAINKLLYPESIATRWRDIINFEDGRDTYPTTIEESTAQMQVNLKNVDESPETDEKESEPAKQEEKAENEEENASKIDVETLRKTEFAKERFNYNEKDVILYSLGVGITKKELSYVYENSPDFKVLPTFSTVPALDYFSKMNLSNILPIFSPEALIQTKHYMELNKTFEPKDNVVSKGRIIDIIKSKMGAILVTAISTYDEEGNEICYNEFQHLLRHVDNYDHCPEKAIESKANTVITIPKRKPDAIVKERTSEDQAILYRLSGEKNPLHVDPAMASIAGYHSPVLQSLCVLAIGTLHIIQTFCYGDVASVKSIQADFVSHVFPGETLQTNMWQDGTKILFNVKALERDVIVISNAAVQLQGQAIAGLAMPDPEKSWLTVEGFKASKIFEKLKATLEATPASIRRHKTKTINAVFQFDVRNDKRERQTWYIDYKNGQGDIGIGKPPQSRADLIVAARDEVIIDLASRKITGQKAYMQSKIKLKGNHALAMKLDSILAVTKPIIAKL
ncbi:NAD(P)-binding protein [Neocallimastix californiae]|uniref:NAD(P)-binding protein n=1 Tax=Neocallimastix californiae TaxID=1754190 RepID=A0A1Y2ENT6_9FUNG|nr:NAD(P)-binding protein [Neocallimastix californiae]|eukprot:ORY73189.1 NAD(P)-binding protein [Neocallimastix californiae]